MAMLKNSRALAQKLCELYIYEPETGRIIRRAPRGMHKVGTIAGSFDRNKYVRLTIQGVNVFVHRAAFVFMTGDWPEGMVDHANGNPSDNRWCNIRVATPEQNSRNCKVGHNSQSGIRGVRHRPDTSKSRPWEVRIKYKGKFIYIGRYASKEEAIAARYAASSKYHGEFAGRIENEKPIRFVEAAHDE